MFRMCAALLLAVTAGVSSGCGSSSDSFDSSPAATLRVDQSGTRDFVTVGSTGVSIFVPEDAVSQETTLGVSPFTSPAVNLGLTGNETFLSGLRFQGFTSLGRPAELRIPVFTTVPFPNGGTIAVFEQTPAGLIPVATSTTTAGFVTFTTLTPGTFVVALVQ